MIDSVGVGVGIADIGAVLCDIDGVLRWWGSHDELERSHDLAVGTIAAAAFAPALLRRAITGELTDEQWRSAVAAELAEVCGGAERACAVIAEWSSVSPRVDPEVVDLLTRARAVVPVALVSNATTRLEDDLRRQGLDGVADVVVSSARVGVAKPDPHIYHVAADRVGVAPDRCLFVDDAPTNVATARELGMTAVLYREPADLATALFP